ncbi:sugar O-acyltransferase (sialic acid O-acetyltransferase NeuD family) [Anseongella ginsenosidimutans]|uniref:Sugar O-acyltransferase (Sialic acid O-acetyltransferase NeuD family) n=1 Tax=Anseongella ginsenosidimutans TaxID=496056 RepID=A0A4R3KLA9_9SPHI|nr:acetyltransferase [Anseongella ginsenosidimutans]TCS84838.1 sugar O-acyltransferase (sialic acid O-acetyltransferase NeuD family) [Anseongella ginsenosidimutans]
MPDNIAIVGYSGHSYVVAEAAIESHMDLKYYSEKAKVTHNPFQLEYIGFEEDPNFPWDLDFQFVLGIGDNLIRNKVASLLVSRRKKILNVIAQHSSCSASMQLGEGNFIARQVAVNSFVEIGNYCILNTGCVIEHECKIGDTVHIAPGAVLAGNVEVGDFSFIGANSVVKQGVRIGANVIIGAGSVIIDDVLDGQKVVGNPGRKI